MSVETVIFISRDYNLPVLRPAGCPEGKPHGPTRSLDARIDTAAWLSSGAVKTFHLLGAAGFLQMKIPVESLSSNDNRAA